MLTAVVLGVLCGARGYLGVVEWLHEWPVDFWHWMGYTRTPPKQDCFRDLLIKLDPKTLETALRSWIADDLQLPISDESLSAISIDGNVLCATLRPFAPAVHLLAAVDHQTGHVLRQCRVSDKTNEHKGALELLKTLCVRGGVIVGDAAFCQRNLCQQIVDSGGDYLVSVKENQPGLLRDIELEFTASPAVFSPPTASLNARRNGKRPPNPTRATVRNAALNFLRTLKTDNLAATIRSFTRNSSRLFAILGFVK